MAENKKRKYRKQRKEKKPPLKLWERALYMLIFWFGFGILCALRISFIVLIKYISFSNPQVVATSIFTLDDALPIAAYFFAVFLWVVFISNLYNNRVSLVIKSRKNLTPQEQEQRELKKRHRQKIKMLMKKNHTYKWFILKIIGYVAVVIVWISAIVFPFIIRTEITVDGVMIKYSAFNNAYNMVFPDEIDVIEITSSTMRAGYPTALPVDYISFRVVEGRNKHEFTFGNLESTEDYISFFNNFDIEKFSIDIDAVNEYIAIEDDALDNPFVQAVISIVELQEKTASSTPEQTAEKIAEYFGF